MSHNLTMAELFCGAGIGAIGFQQAGYNIVWGADFNEYAIKSYNMNIGNHGHVLDVRTLKAKDIPDVDVITGGFPCQPFSIGGAQRGEHDEKSGNLGYHFFRLIIDKQPKAFIAENVEGLTFEKNMDFFIRLMSDLNKNGYNVAWKVVDCWHYGVPQTRDRVFIVGIRKDLNKEYYFPEFVPVTERTCLRDAIADLPFHVEGSNIPNHEYIKTGFSPRALKDNRQRQWHEPAFTVVSSVRHLTIHPEPANFDFLYKTKEEVLEAQEKGIIRRFTVRECLRLQTVPDSYVFPEDEKYANNREKLLEKQYERCSGIPPLVAYKLSKQLADILTSNIEHKKPTQNKLF